MDARLRAHDVDDGLGLGREWMFRWVRAGDGRLPGLWEAGCLHSGRALLHDKGRIRDMTISNYGEQASAAAG